MDKKRKTIVVQLTPEAKRLLAESLLRQFLRADGEYFLCSSTQERGYFVDLEVTMPHPETHEEISRGRISLPANFVLFMATGTGDIKELGFKE